MRTEDGLVDSTESGRVAVRLRKPKLAIDLPTRTAEVGAAVPDGELVHGQDLTDVVAEATHNGVDIRKGIILVAIGAVDDAAGPGVNLPIIAPVVILPALDRGHARVGRFPVPLHGCLRIPGTHPELSTGDRQQFRQNGKLFMLAVWSLR